MNHHSKKIGANMRMRVDHFSVIHDLFEKYGVKDPLLETKHVFDLLGGEGKEVGLNLLGQEKIDFINLVQKRKEGMPLEYILGLAGFMGRIYYCSTETFIPKKETELLCKITLDFINKSNDARKLTVIDIGTGCGNIAVTLALNSCNTKFFASDINPKALEVTKKNVDKYGLREKISLICGDLFSPFKNSEHEGKIDFIVCNPPYIPTGSLHKLPPEIVDYEPVIALDGGQFGIDFFRRLITEAVPILKPGGILIFEMGLWQERLISKILINLNEYEQTQYFGNESNCKVASIKRR